MLEKIQTQTCSVLFSVCLLCHYQNSVVVCVLESAGAMSDFRQNRTADGSGTALPALRSGTFSMVWLF